MIWKVNGSHTLDELKKAIEEIDSDRVIANILKAHEEHNNAPIVFVSYPVTIKCCFDACRDKFNKALEGKVKIMAADKDLELHEAYVIDWIGRPFNA